MSSASHANLAKWFSKVDRDRKGRLTAFQLQEALRNNNYSMFHLDVVRLMIKMFDRDNNNTIELHEFVQLWDFLGSWRTVFDRFDTDRSGNISPSELTLALQQLGYQFSQHFVPILMQKFDFHKTGSLQFDGFVHSILMIRRLTAAFQPYDTYRNGQAHFTYEQFLATVIENTI